MSNEMTGLETLAQTISAYLIKGIPLFVGGILSLILTRDINKDGYIKITMGIIFRLMLSMLVGLYLSGFVIEYMEWQDKNEMFKGSILMCCATFGILFLGIIYQAIFLLKGHSLAEIAEDINSATRAIVGRPINKDKGKDNDN